MLRNELTKFIQDNLLRNDPTAIGPEDSLIDSGIMNSTALLSPRRPQSRGLTAHSVSRLVCEVP
jgi:hypothetical protein